MKDPMSTVRIPERVPFLCTRCGKCCLVSGKHITIERKLGERDYYCRDRITGNLVMARVEAPYTPYFRQKTDENSDRCFFLISTPEGYTCAVYSTRPLSCRNFRCCHMRIFLPDGAVAGTVKGRRSLSTDNTDLIRVWDDSVRDLRIENDGQWDNEVVERLKSAGYRVELYTES
jgi:uncharacterized protein